MLGLLAFTVALPSDSYPHPSCNRACGQIPTTADGKWLGNAKNGKCYECVTYGLPHACGSYWDIIDKPPWSVWENCCKEFDCTCHDGCYDNMIGDGKCDSACNNQACAMSNGLPDGGDCAPPAPSPPPPRCVPTVKGTAGYWVPVASCATSEPCEFAEEVGTSSSSQQESLTSWQNDVQNSIKNSLDVRLGIGASAGKGKAVGGPSVKGSLAVEYSRSMSFTGATASALSTLASQSFRTSYRKAVTRTFTGVLWQFQFAVDDNCDGATIMVADHVAETANAAEPPCCIPTFTLDPKRAHGACTLIEACLTNGGGCEAKCTEDYNPTADSRGTDYNPPPATEEDDVEIGPIVGGVVGGVASILIFILALVYIRKNKRGGAEEPKIPPVSVGVEVHTAAVPAPSTSSSAAEVFSPTSTTSARLST
mmetsp:Transcript_29732/g.95605  ORF Transcript_29732/g.95605 Transcript_29732/m.95605 type:complete len:423 (+) Transcript_29732:91-1359(+)